jgi:hypothetical protein
MSSRRLRESRRSRRTPKRQGAWIGLQGGRIPCVIWDQSAEGARIAAPRSKKLPDTFTLLLSRDGKSRRFCRVAWRSDSQVGIQFIEALDEDDTEFEAPQPARYPLSAKPAADKPSSPVGAQNPPAPASLRAPIQDQHAAAPIQAGAPNRSIFIKPPVTESAPIAGWASSCAAVFTLMLAIATALFYVARIHSGGYLAWTGQVCDRAHELCAHPEMTGFAALLMGVVFIAVRGMERN